MTRSISIACVFAVGLAPAAAVLSDGPSYAVPWYTIDGGGGTSSGGGFELIGIIGQPDTAELSGGGFVLQGGFSQPPDAGVPFCPADFDSSGDVEAFDLAVLLGAWGPCPEPCTEGDPGDTCQADLNGDCVVEAFDLALLLGAWGPCGTGGAVCGDDVAEGFEVCDGIDLQGETCVSQGFSGGELACLPDCTGFDTSGCF